MTLLISRRRTIMKFAAIALIVSSAYLTLACSSPRETRAPGAASGTPTGSLTPGVISAQGGLVFGPGSFHFPKPSAGLANLASYKGTLSLSFDGKEAGQPRQWSKTYTLLSTLQPAARQLTIEKPGQFPDPDPVFMAEVAGTAYERRGKGSCTATAIAAGDSLAEQMEPAGFLVGIIGAEKAGSETVNGVAANRYTFDERALGELGVTKSKGELWVASDGGYVVKYVLTTKGGADYFGEGSEGSVTWNYQLTDVNQPLVIGLPKDCPAGIVDAPLLPNATGVVKLPGVLSFTTATSLAEAIAFYQKQLPASGWQPAADLVRTETLMLQDFSRGDQQMSVIVATGDGSTTVQIVVGVRR